LKIQSEIFEIQCKIQLILLINVLFLDLSSYKIFKIARLDMVQNLTYNESNNEYFIDTETLIMDAKLFGQLVSIETELKYYDYKKVEWN